MVETCEDVYIPASASVFIAATCLEIKLGLNLVHSFFSFPCFFTVISFDLDIKGQLFLTSSDSPALFHGNQRGLLPTFCSPVVDYFC